MDGRQAIEASRALTHHRCSDTGADLFKVGVAQEGVDRKRQNAVCCGSCHRSERFDDSAVGAVAVIVVGHLGVIDPRFDPCFGELIGELLAVDRSLR